MIKQNRFKLLFLIFLLNAITGSISLNISAENIETASRLNDDVFTEQQCSHPTNTPLLFLSHKWLRIYHFNSQKQSYRNFNRTLTGSNELNDNNNYLTLKPDNTTRHIRLRNRRNSDKSYFLYTLRRINI